MRLQKVLFAVAEVCCIDDFLFICLCLPAITFNNTKVLICAWPFGINGWFISASFPDWPLKGSGLTAGPVQRKPGH